MIAYEDLCAALASYRARTRGEEPPAPAPSRSEASAGYDPPTSAHTLPTEQPLPEVATQVAQLPDVQTVYDDRSNELDLGDVLSDDEIP
jgi:hypothetical protein